MVNMGRKAPNGLLTDMIAAVQREDWLVAHNLCEEIIRIEPDNAQAQEMLSVIVGNIQYDMHHAGGVQEHEGEDGADDEDDEEEEFKIDEDDEDEEEEEEEDDLDSYEDEALMRDSLEG
eukprot:Clim_evm18s154 gene=Clim_evmTU18s154